MTDLGNDRMRLCVWVHVSMYGRLFSAEFFRCKILLFFVNHPKVRKV